MSRFTKKAFRPLDQEEIDLMETIEKEEWQPVENLDREKRKAVQTAHNTLKKDKRINYHEKDIKKSAKRAGAQTG